MKSCESTKCGSCRETSWVVNAPSPSPTKPPPPLPCFETDSNQTEQSPEMKFNSWDAKLKETDKVWNKPNTSLHAVTCWCHSHGDFLGMGGRSGCKYCRGTTKCSEAKLYSRSMKRQRREVRREGADLGPLLRYRSVGAAESESVSRQS